MRAAEQHGDRTALTMVMTGDDDEELRQVSFAELLGLVTRTMNFLLQPEDLQALLESSGRR